jgi:hypothetical protein
MGRRATCAQPQKPSNAPALILLGHYLKLYREIYASIAKLGGGVIWLAESTDFKLVKKYAQFGYISKQKDWHNNQFTHGYKLRKMTQAS